MRNPDSRDDVADQDTTGRTVVGMFTNRPDAEAAIRELKAAAEGAAKGAVSGGLVGGLIGLLGSLVAVGAGARTGDAVVILDRHGMDFGPSGASRYASGIQAGGEVARERGRYRGNERRTTPGATYAGRSAASWASDRSRRAAWRGGRMALSPVVLADYRVPRKEQS